MRVMIMLCCDRVGACSTFVRPFSGYRRTLTLSSRSALVHPTVSAAQQSLQAGS